MTQDTTYNGWTNYATWRVNLEICDDLIAHAIDGEQWPDTIALAHFLEQAVDDVLTGYGEVTDGLTLDYARAFVSDVDFREIAEHAVADNPELIESDEEEIA
jgi:hypothetical protein